MQGEVCLVTDRETHELVERWRKLLAPEFTVVLKGAPPPDADDPENFNAIVQRPSDYNVLRLWLNRDREREDLEVERTVIHELLHGVLRDMGELLYRATSNLPEQERLHLSILFGSAEERAVDRVSRLLLALDRGFDPFVTRHEFPSETETSGDSIETKEHQGGE